MIFHIVDTKKIVTLKDRVLLYHNPSINVLNEHLAKYEISSIEPMHDTAGYIKNIFTELPSV